MKFLFPFFAWFFVALNAHAEFLLAESGSLSAKIYTPSENWCNRDVVLNVKSPTDDDYTGSVDDLLAKMQPFLVSLCADTKTMHITNNGNYVKDSSFKLVDASWVAMSNNEVSQLHAKFVPLVVETKQPVADLDASKPDVEGRPDELSKIEPIKEAPVDKSIEPVSQGLIENKIESITDKAQYNPSESNSTQAEINAPESLKSDFSVIPVSYNSNDGKFVMLSFLTIIMFVSLIYFFIKYSKFDKLITARIVVISTLVFSGLSALSMIIDLTHVDPLIKMAVRSFFVSVFLASLYALVSWIFAIRFMISELRELTSLSTGYYESLFKDFKEDLAKLGLDEKKIKIYVDENSEVVNAYAYTSFMGTSCVVINKPLIENLTADEVRAVVVHELGHIKHQDSAMMTIIMMTKDAIDRIVLAPVTLTRFAIRYVFSGIGIAFRSMNQAGVMALFIIFAISVFILGYAALMIVMFMLPGLLIDVFFNISAFKHSRDREFEADRTVKEVGLGENLANALIRLHNMGQAVVLPTAQARAFMGAPSNFNTHSGINGSYSFASDSWISPTKWTKQFKPHLFTTHPNPEERISKLRGTTSD